MPTPVSLDWWLTRPLWFVAVGFAVFLVASLADADEVVIDLETTGLHEQAWEGGRMNSGVGARVVLALDQVTDPHNVGAILRSATAFAVDAVLTTTRHSAAESGVLAKSASGALDVVPVTSVRNLGDTLEEMKAAGFTVVGLDSEAPEPLDEVRLSAPVCLVLGAEGKGLRQRTRELCDVLARIDMPGEIKSLNVSNAAVLSLYLVRKALG